MTFQKEEASCSSASLSSLKMEWWRYEAICLYSILLFIYNRSTCWRFGLILSTFKGGRVWTPEHWGPPFQFGPLTFGFIWWGCGDWCQWSSVVALLGDWRSSAGARGEHLSKVVIGPPGQCGSGGLKDLPPTSNMMVLSSSFLVLGSLDPLNSWQRSWRPK